MDSKKTEHIEKPKRVAGGRWSVVVIAGIAINLLCAVIAKKLQIPLFFDTVGTILTTILGGYLPGITVALATNLLKGLMESYAVYYAILNVLVAVTTYVFSRKGWLKRFGTIVLYTLLLTLIGGGFGSVLTWQIEGFPQTGRYVNFISFFYKKQHMGEFLSLLCAELSVDLVDKILSVIMVLLVLKVITEDMRRKFKWSGWRQTPLHSAEKKLTERAKCRRVSLKTKIVGVLVAACLSLAVLATWISMMLFERYTKVQHTKLATGTARLAAAVIDADKVEDFLQKGKSAQGYKETEALLYQIRESSPDIEYVYVYKIEEDGCHVVFDLDTEELLGEEPGTVVDFDPSFYPYLSALMAGEKIEPIISDDKYGWLLTVYEPVYAASGECVCYAAADVAMMDLTHYEQDFFVKMSTLFLSFFVLILAIGLWLAEYNLILPINSMAVSASAFAYDTDEERDENVERIRNLAIVTGDEVENLYSALQKTTEDSMQYVEQLEQTTETISQMQSGLIMVLADMVENRDDSTGEHVRKTAAYTGLIMRHLKKKGYYTEQLTEKFMQDVERSAPLHDIGKVKIPDAVLNKPGKLTDEEFAIMKTHTSEGKKIIEEAIVNVKGIEYLEQAKYLAGYHHEKWNGTGYPEGLAGEAIPLSARIMAVADVFDALVSKRCYKDAFSFEKAMGIIKEGAGNHFDPKIVEAFVDAEAEVREVAENFDKMRQ